MKLTCSCGASGEFRDNFAGSVDARKWSEDHAVCRAALAAEPTQEPVAPNIADAAEMLWIVLANVSGGDWSQQTPEWQEACIRWRDYYFAARNAPPQTPMTDVQVLQLADEQEWGTGGSETSILLLARAVERHHGIGPARGG